MRTPLTMTLAAVGLVLAACGAPTDEPGADPVTDETSATDRADADAEAVTPAAQPELGAACGNPRDGYRINYPSSWHVNDGEVTAACRAFDVEPPTIEPDTVLPLASSVLLIVEDHDLDAMRDLIAEDPATDVDALEEEEIDGRTTLRVDGTATGEAYLDAGVEVHRTYVEFDGRTLIAQASELGEPELEVRRGIIEEMVATLQPLARAQEEATEDADATSEAAGEDATSEAAGEDATSEAAADEDRAGLIAEATRAARDGGHGRADLVDVRVGHHDGFARLALEFEDAVPSYEVAPTDGPILAFPSGEDLELAGEHHLEVVTSGTRVDLTGTEAVETYDGPLRLEGPGGPVVEVAMAGDHHGQMTWVIGLDAPADFAVAELEDPARIVVDVVDQG